MKIRKIIGLCLCLLMGIFGFVGCSCEEEETMEAKYLRLYDLDKSGKVDDWETPFNFNEYNGVQYNTRKFVDHNGNYIENEEITFIHSQEEFNKLNVDADKKKNMVFAFRNGTYFKRGEEQKIACYGARAYIVEITSAEDLIKFAESNLTQVDSYKYILSIASDISFRTQDSSGDPLQTFKKQELINVNGAQIYGNGKTIEGFKMMPNADLTSVDNQAGKYDSIVNNYVNYKYSLISNASMVFDLNIHLGYVDISFKPEGSIANQNINLIIDCAPLRNIMLIDNVMTRGKIDIQTSALHTAYGSDNTNINMEKINVSMLAVAEDDIVSMPYNQGNGVFIPFSSKEEGQDAYYDYDKLVETTRTEVLEEVEGENGEKEDVVVGYNYEYMYSNKMPNFEINNAKVEGYINYKENINTQVTELTNSHYDPPKHLNIGGIFANANNAYYNTINSSSNMSVNIHSGSNIFLGGIMSDMSYDSFAENNNAVLVAKIESVGRNGSIEENSPASSNIGGVCGFASDFAEIKNCNTNLKLDFVADNPKVQDYNKYISNVSAGGVVGTTRGFVVACRPYSDINISYADISTTGGVAGASVNAVFVKDVSNTNMNIVDATNSYTGALVGSCIGGSISTCFVEANTNISGSANPNEDSGAEIKTNEEDGTFKLNKAYYINTGLLYFESKNFYLTHLDILAEKAIDGIEAQSYDSIFKEGKIQATESAPKCINNMIIENTNINYELIVEEQDEMVVLGKYVNIGGYYIYRFDASHGSISANSEITYENIEVLNIYNSNYAINGNKSLDYYVQETVENKTKNIKITIDQNLAGEDGGKQLTKVPEFKLSSIKSRFQYNGINKEGVCEIDLIDPEAPFSLANIKINNIYPGRYLSPNGFKDLQLDKDLFADLNIETYDEFEYILDIFMKKEKSNIYNQHLSRKDLFKNLLVLNLDMFEVDNGSELYYKDMELNSEGSEYRYKKDENGNYIYESPENTKIDVNDKIYFGKDINGNIYAFKKEGLNYTEEDGIYDIGKDDTAINEKINSINPAELMYIIRLVYVMGVNYLKLDFEPQKEMGLGVDDYSKLIVSIYYINDENENTNRVDIYCLNTIPAEKPVDSDLKFITTFYFIKTNNNTNS